jgi:hypothetical protein
MAKYYMNMFDSTILANFKGHIENTDDFFSVYNKESESKYSFIATLRSTLEKLKKGNDTLVMTLNQICDNRILFTEDIPKILCQLLESGKLKISCYNGFDLLSYSTNALEQCLIRICSSTPDFGNKYISSLFPDLGKEYNTKSATKRNRVASLLGRNYKDLTYVDEKNYFKYASQKVICFKDFSIKVKNHNYTYRKKKRYGYYTFLKKCVNRYKKLLSSSNFDANDILKEDIEFPSQVQHTPKLLALWVNNLIKLHECAVKNNAYIENTKYKDEHPCLVNKKFSCLGWILNGFIQNETLFNEKLSFWLESGFLQPKLILPVKEGIKSILLDLCNDSKNRSQMYSNAKNIMERYSQTLDDDDLKRYFKTTNLSDEEDRRRYYTEVYHIVVMCVDFAYNIQNMFYSNEDLSIIEMYYRSRKETGDSKRYIDFSSIKKTKYAFTNDGILKLVFQEDF